MLENDILRAELERLFELDELLKFSHDVLGFDPESVGDTFAKASFAGALTAHCAENDAIEALCDGLIASRRGVSSAVENIRIQGLTREDELRPGDFGGFRDLRKLAAGRAGINYVGRDGDTEYRIKVFRREVARDRRGLHQVATLTRLLAALTHPGLPRALVVGKAEGRPYVAHEHVRGTPLSGLDRGTPRFFGEARALLREILEALAALHECRIVHGNLRLENVIVAEADGRAVLVDAGGDRLRARTLAAGGPFAPEQLRGLCPSAQSDVYAFGAVMFELLSGEPLFDASNPLKAALGHASEAPRAPSSVAPRGFASPELDDFVLRLLAKDPSARPQDACAVLALFDRLAIGAKPRAPELDAETLAALSARLETNPRDSEAALSLEEAGAGSELAERAGARLEQAARAEDGDKTSLLRAARVFASRPETRVRAEAAYLEYIALAPEDPAPRAALLELRRRLGKLEEVLEMLLAEVERATSPVEKARVFAEIGRIYANESGDTDQALVAFTQAFLEDPRESAYALEVERLAGSRLEAWNEVLETAAAAEPGRDLDARALILNRLGHWWSERALRLDLGAASYRNVLGFDPGNDAALEGLAQIYRRAEQWQDLALLLTERAHAATPERARALRTEAAALYEGHLNDLGRAKALYEQVVRDDPAHPRAAAELARLYERTGDHAALVVLLEKGLVAKRGEERTHALCRIAEVFENDLNDPVEAARRFSAALDHDPTSVEALRGLDRAYARQGRFRELLENLERQLELAATPRQKISLLERALRIAAEEFLDPGKAAEYAERILAIDPAHSGALETAIRSARSLEHWEEVAALYERQLAGLGEPQAKLEAQLELARVLGEHVGAPERAARAYEAALAIDAREPRALEALARLRESAGDTERALEAIEALAQKATSPEARSEQWVRAARLLAARGDRDGAIERYKRALDANPKDAAASAGLRDAYTARGDTSAAIALLERALDDTQGALAKGALLGQIARLYHQGSVTDPRAEDAAKRALALDPTNADALETLGEAAFADGRYLEATRHFEALAARGEALERDRLARALLRYAEALGRAGTPEKAVQPMEQLLKLSPDRGAVKHAAEVLFAHGSPERAAEVYADLAATSQSETGEARAELLYRQGESLRRSGRLDRALEPLEEAVELAPSGAAPWIALSKIHEAEGRWSDAIKVKLRHLDVAAGDERVQLLLDASELSGSKLGDRTQAAKLLVAALDERPDDRRLLTRLMQLYSEEKDWNRLVEVVLRLADFVEDPKQRVKYLHTAAIVTARQVENPALAVEYYEQVLALDPSFDKAITESIELRRGLADHAGVERLLRKKLELATAADDTRALVETFDELGALYEQDLGWIEQAIDASEAAHTLDPVNTARSERLRRLYATDPERYLEKAVMSERELLRANPYDAASYRALRRLYTEAKRADEAFCLCQALSVQNLAEPDEERFFKRMRPETAAPAERPIDDESWLLDVMHPDADPLLTSVFALIEPAVIARRSAPLADLGYDESWRVNVAEHPAPLCQSLYYAAGVLGLPVPPCYENPNDPGGVSFLFAPEPSLVLGVAGLRTDVPLRVAAFIAAHKLASLRPGMYVRQLLASGTALKAWLFGAIKLTSPTFPVAPELEGAVNEALAALDSLLQGQVRDHLTRVVAKLLTSGAALDLKRWVVAVDLTADRAGFLVAHDLHTALEVIRAADDGKSPIAIEDRVREILLYAVSSEYLGLRRKLNITVDS
jgi:tetratricopeptide (TPR) repeat protein/predicted Ser/Thr protein kinase